MRAAVPAALASLCVLALACGSDTAPLQPADEQRGLRRVAGSPPPAPAPPPPVVFREAPADPFRRTPPPGPAVPSATGAPAPDGGLPAGDAGPVPTDDHALAATVEAQGRAFARCFPATLTNLPDVSIEFQISVTGIVTRNEVRGGGLDEAMRTCLASTASAIRFPGQESPRTYRYPMRLRRTPPPDGGPPRTP